MVVTPETSKASVGEYKANESYPEFYLQLATPRMTISDFERKRQANEDKSRPIDLRKGVRTIPQSTLGQNRSETCVPYCSRKKS
jgi:hypothetical protein